MTQQSKKYYTAEEYLELEDKAEHKSEYWQGEIFQMAGGSVQHSLICVNISTALNLKLRNRPCAVFNSDLKVLVKVDGAYTYPDITVVCGEIQFAQDKKGQPRSDIVTNPVLLVEGLSASTEDLDRRDKFRLYRGLASLQHYLLVSQEQQAVDYYQKTAQGWLLRSYEEPAASLNLKIGGGSFKLALAAIYNKVSFG